MKKIKIALVGAGKIANRHATHISNYAELSAVCDIEIQKAKTLGEKYNVPYFGRIEDMIASDIGSHVYSICTPNGLHSEHSILALNSGFHVLCEKPMGISVFECGEMIKAAERNNKRLFAIKQNRFNPPVAAVKEAIDAGKLGKVLSIQLSCFWNRNEDYYANSWKGTMVLDGGTLYTQFSHFIDLLYWIVGDVKTTTGFSRNSMHQNIIEFEDSGVVAIEFYNGVIGTINYTVNSYGKNMEGSLTLFCENGTVKIGGQYLNELEYQNIEGFEFSNLPSGNLANNYGNYQGSMSNHDKIYENLVEVLQYGGSISTSAFEGLKTVEIIDKIYSSIRK
jgi:UDP-N-acetyl-2-amino-2-deoxyglucuronate dehydrogenase